MIRPLLILRVLLGAVLLLAPERALGNLFGRRVRTPVRVFARVLGARHLVQAAVAERHPGPGWTRAGAVVDAIHAAVAAVLAVALPHQRKPAAVNAIVATALAVDGLRLARRLTGG